MVRRLANVPNDILKAICGEERGATEQDDEDLLWFIATVGGQRSGAGRLGIPTTAVCYFQIGAKQSSDGRAPFRLCWH